MRFRHIREVLKTPLGQTVKVGLLNGPIGDARVERLDDTGVDLCCTWRTEAPVVGPQLELLLAMPRPKVLRRLWAQLAALGVSRIRICAAEKVERYYFDSHVLDEGVVHPLLIEGLQQSGTTTLPEVSVHRRFRPLIEDELAGYPDKRVGVPGSRISLHQGSAAERVLLAIGPEGGWSAFELGLFEANGFTAVGLGDRILRSDTACIAAVALLRDALFDF